MDRSWTAMEWVADLDSSLIVSGDSTSLVVNITEDLDPISLSAALAMEDTSASTSASLLDLQLQGHIGSTSISLAILLPEFEGIQEPFPGIVPPFSVSTVALLGELGGVDWVRVEDGTVLVSITNGLPCPVFEPLQPPENRVLRLLAADDHRVIAEHVVPGALDTGERLEVSFDVGEQVVPGSLALQIVGSSPGSVGNVMIDVNATIDLEAFTSETFVVSALEGRPEPMSGSVETTVDLGSEFGIQNATVSSGELRVEFNNAFPLPIRVRIEIPDLRLDGSSFSLETVVPGESRLEVPVDLADALLSGGNPLVRVHAATENRPEQSVAVTREDFLGISVSAGSVSFSQVTAAFPEPVAIAMDPMDTGLSDFPANIDPVAPSGTIVVTNRPAFDMSVDLIIEAVGGGGSLHITGPLHGASDSLPIDPDELAAFLSAGVDRLEIHGTVSFDEAVVTLRAEDVISCRIEVELPFEFDVRSDSHLLDPAIAQIDPQQAELLLAYVKSASLVAVVESDFPIGLTLELRAVAAPSGEAPDSLGAENTLATLTLPTPSLDDHGHAIATTRETLRIDLDGQQIDELFGESHLATGAVIHIPDAGIVSIYGNDHLRVHSHLEFSTMTGGE